MLMRKHETAIRSFPQAQKQMDARFSGGGLHYPHYTEGEQRSQGIEQLDLEEQIHGQGSWFPCPVAHGPADSRVLLG